MEKVRINFLTMILTQCDKNAVENSVRNVYFIWNIFSSIKLVFLF